MDISIEGMLFAVLGTLAVFGGIALCMWIDHRSKIAQRQLEHAERLKSLELGRDLPDAEVARAAAEGSAAWAAGLVGLFVPPVVVGGGVAATALVLLNAAEHIHLPLLCTIWGVCGLVCIVAIHSSVNAVRRRQRTETAGDRSDNGPSGAERPLDPRQLDLEFVDKR